MLGTQKKGLEIVLFFYKKILATERTTIWTAVSVNFTHWNFLLMLKSERQKAIHKFDTVFSEYIRYRDCDKNGNVHCPLCWAVVPLKKAQNMHFIPRWVLKYRWSEQNCYAGCYRCNVALNGNYIIYTRFMQRKYGVEKVDEMINDKAPYKIPTWEIEDKTRVYEVKLKLLKQEKFGETK